MHMVAARLGCKDTVVRTGRANSHLAASMGIENATLTL